MKLVHLKGLALLLLALAASVAAGSEGAATPPPAAEIDVHATETLLTFPGRDTGTGAALPDLGALVALPSDATGAQAFLISGQATEVAVVGKVQYLRGQPAVTVCVRGATDGPVTVAVRYDGSWAAKADQRLASPALSASLPGLPAASLKAAGHPLGGSYVIVTDSLYVDAIAPLADWKTRKGWPVVVVTTDDTGTTNESIKAWLQDAYDTWQRPPEYVLLVGDVDVIPAFSFSSNVTDLPYSLLDGDDWLPDLMLGRFSVSNQTECQAMVAKTVHYEQTPYTDQTDWFTRSIMVAGQYASSTPKHTVRFCGDQLASIGFDAMDPITPVDFDGNYVVSPYQGQDEYGIPLNLGPMAIKTAIDAGASVVAYRGWAYGTAGWEPPHYTVMEIPGLANGAMMPVVMSFVCLNGNFAGAAPCFGEVFTRTGGDTPEQFRGAVAFIGNGEHWSHTRFNGAMAIGFFERIVVPEITTLGALLNAGKLRFMEYFPGELDETGDEESVEFYFHIYILLGDPELNYHRAVPTQIVAVHVDDVATGTTFIDVTAFEADGSTPLGGARIGVAQGGVLLGAAITAAEGTASVVLSQAVAEGPVNLTVSHADRLPHLALLNATTSGVFLSLDNLDVGDEAPGGAGNGDGEANPAETLALDPTMRNLGSATSSGADLVLTVTGPATVGTGTVSLGGLAPGASGSPASPWTVDVAAAAADGAIISGRISANHGSETDLSGFELVVSAPEFMITAANAAGQPWLDPGATADLTLTMINEGSLDTDGGNLQLSLQAPDGIELLTTSVTFGAAGAGETITAGPISVSVDPAVGAGRTATIDIVATCDEGAILHTSVSVPIGDGSVSEPYGPDRHGYYAYDSADYLYPDQRPVYRWREISTAFGGLGTKLPFVGDNNDRDVIVDLPFDFMFYGQVFSRVRVADNGWISFEADNDFYNFYNWTIPSAHGNGALVAPFWDNLTPEPAEDPDADPVGLDSDGIYWYHDADRHEVIFEWSRMRHVYPQVTELQSFQLVLRDPDEYMTDTGDGEILFFYKHVADNDHLRMYATVGLESPDETDGLQLTYDNVRAVGTLPLGPGGAVRLTTAEPVRVPVTVSSLQRRGDDGTVHLTWTCNDTRPVTGWRVYTFRDGARVDLSELPLAANARSCEVLAESVDALFLEALLPHGTVSEAGKAQSAGTNVAFTLGEARPNPMRGESAIAFALPRSGNVRLRVFDLKGRCVRTLIDGRAESGGATAVWRGRDDQGRQVADGVYFYRLEHAGKNLTRKVLLVR